MDRTGQRLPATDDGTLVPTAVATDATRAYVGVAATTSSIRQGVAVFDNKDLPALRSYLRIRGATAEVGGLTWCNQQ